MIDVKDKTKCCGCSACVQKCPKQCISLIEDEEGFLYPKVNQNQCVDCGLCEEVCPIQNKVETVEPIKVFASYNLDERVRIKSSSGGIFTFLAEKTIKENGIVFGARFNDNFEVVIDYTDTLDGLDAFRGSKYVQASVGDSYQKCERFLKEDRQVLFSGTPCQIAGLKRFLGNEYDNLLLVDVVCHGVPSPMVWQKYLQELTSGDVNKICDVKFRDKTSGWKDYHFRISRLVELSDCEELIVDESHKDNIFMQAFLSDLILRPVCYFCSFRGVNHRQADISIADFWGVDDITPEINDDKGISLVFLNTDKGVKCISFAKMAYREVDIYRIIDYNGGLQESIKYNVRRERFFRKIRKSNGVIKQMQIHVLPEWQYQEEIMPWYKKVLITFKCKISTGAINFAQLLNVIE